jgi:hypothetical protein
MTPDQDARLTYLAEWNSGIHPRDAGILAASGRAVNFALTTIVLTTLVNLMLFILAPNYAFAAGLTLPLLAGVFAFMAMQAEQAARIASREAHVVLISRGAAAGDGIDALHTRSGRMWMLAALLRLIALLLVLSAIGCVASGLLIAFD